MPLLSFAELDGYLWRQVRQEMMNLDLRKGENIDTLTELVIFNILVLRFGVKLTSGHFGNEVARVLGGGLAPGFLILIGGEHGIGKSTLLLQIASIIADGSEPTPALYVSGEESVETLRTQADRISIPTDQLYLFSSTDLPNSVLKSSQLRWL